jgi:antitoxin HicB
MRLRYPAKLTTLQDGNVMAEFRDVPEAITQGKDADNALHWAQDALLVALSGYLDDHRAIPRPSKPKHGERLVEVPPMQALKLAIYQTMQERDITQVELGERMGIDARQVRRILDLDHASRLDHLLRALAVLGKRVIVDIQDAA